MMMSYFLYIVRIHFRQIVCNNSRDATLNCTTVACPPPQLRGRCMDLANPSSVIVLEDSPECSSIRVSVLFCGTVPASLRMHSIMQFPQLASRVCLCSTATTAIERQPSLAARSLEWVFELVAQVRTELRQVFSYPRKHIQWKTSIRLVVQFRNHSRMHKIQERLV
jgi:hypothetical protein